MKMFEGFNPKGMVKGLEEYMPLFKKVNVPEKYKNTIKTLADESAAAEIPICKAGNYREFVLNGNRRRYETPYFERRNILINLTLGELVFDDGRYIDALIDIIWAICEETTWVLPAHNAHDKTYQKTNQLGAYYEDDVFFIDLFSAMTGAQIAIALYLFKDKLERACPNTVVRRMEYELNRQIIHPLERNNKEFWWSGYDREYVNNWNPWIVSNLMTVVAVSVKELEKREELTALCCKMIDVYINCIHSDGYCDEGASYWSVSIGALHNFFEVLEDVLIDGKDIIKKELLVKAYEYIYKVHIGGNNQYINFCDCKRFCDSNYNTIYRMGKFIESQRLMDFAGKYADDSKINFNKYLSYSSINNIATEVEPCDFNHDDCYYFDKWQIMVARNVYGDRNIFVAAKAGANNEGHGHLDNGSFILYINEKPILFDYGSPEYTKDTFNQNRFKHWAMRSIYHNTPSVDDIEEHFGGKYRSTNVVQNGKSLEMELKESFENSDGIKTLKRTINAENGLIVTDEYEFDYERTYKFNLLTNVIPEVKENNLIIHTVYGFDVEFNMTDGYEVSTQEVPIHDHFISTWDTDNIYRTVISKKGKYGKFEFKLS